MAAQLPPPPVGGAPLPPQPHNPPTLNDIFNAIDYNTQIRARHDVANGAIYENAVIAENAGPAVAPPWFADALAGALAGALAATLPNILNGILAPLIRTIAVTHNLSCGDGRQRQFQIVPFVNGDMPAQHNLPPLYNEAQIDELGDAQAIAYLGGYNVLPIPPTPVARNKAIRARIGVPLGFDFCRILSSPLRMFILVATL